MIIHNVINESYANTLNIEDPVKRDGNCEIHYIRQLITTWERTWFVHGLIFEDIQDANNSNPRVDTFALATWYSRFRGQRRNSKIGEKCRLHALSEKEFVANVYSMSRNEKQRYRVHLRAIHSRVVPFIRALDWIKRHTTPHLNLREDGVNVKFERDSRLCRDHCSRDRNICAGVFLTFNFPRGEPSLDQ